MTSQDAASQAAVTPDAALALLADGNARFVAGTPVRRDYGAQIRATAAGQYPFAVVLGCIDSRVPVETVFDQGIGDIFAAGTGDPHRGRDVRRRYALFGDVALNGRGTGNGSTYLALYNEVFMNGELEIGRGRTVERFDRNRFYTALGFGVGDRSQVQAGYMIQTLPGGSKGQIQISLHTSFLEFGRDAGSRRRPVVLSSLTRRARARGGGAAPGSRARCRQRRAAPLDDVLAYRPPDWPWRDAPRPSPQPTRRPPRRQATRRSSCRPRMLRHRLPSLLTRQEREIRIVGGMYDVSTGAVRFL